MKPHCAYVMENIIRFGNHLVSAIDIITVGEYRCKVTLTLSTNIVMVIMVIWATVKWNILRKRPREVVPASITIS